MFSAGPLHRSHCVCVSVTKSSIQNDSVTRSRKMELEDLLSSAALQITQNETDELFFAAYNVFETSETSTTTGGPSLVAHCCQTAGYSSVRLRPQRYFRSQTSPSPYLSPPPTSFSSSRRRRDGDDVLLHVKIMYLCRKKTRFSMKKQGSLSCFHVSSVAYEVYYEKSGTSYRQI